MSTRSITHIHEAKELSEEEKNICSFYRYHNGEPDGHGNTLIEWLDGKKIGNYLVEERNFKSVGSMSIKLMAYIQGISECEVIPTGSTDLGEEYIYDIYFRDGNFCIEVKDRSENDPLPIYG